MKHTLEFPSIQLGSQIHLFIFQYVSIPLRLPHHLEEMVPESVLARPEYLKRSTSGEPLLEREALGGLTGLIAITLINFALVVCVCYRIGIVARTWEIGIKQLAGLNHRQFARALSFILNPLAFGDGFFQHIVQHLVAQLGELRRSIFHLCMLDRA
jgi:hypothetical protein